MMQICAIKDNKLIENIPQSKVKYYLKQKNVTLWFDLYKSVQKEYDFIKTTFDLHPLSMEDCARPLDLPKVDHFDKYLFIVFHGVAPEHEKVDFKRREMDFFLGKNFLITVHSYNSDIIDAVIEKLKESKINGLKADFLMYKIMDDIVDQYFPLLDEWQDHIEDLEEGIIESKHTRDALKKVMHIKKEVLHIRKSIAPQIEMVNNFSKKDHPFLSHKTSLYFKDIYDHLMRIYSELETQRDLLKNAFDAHTTLISTNMIENSNKMNEVMKKLTIIATIFMPLTFITGIYGMNFQHMPELYWKYGYFIILGVMLLVGLLMFKFFKKKDWV